MRWHFAAFLLTRFSLLLLPEFRRIFLVPPQPSVIGVQQYYSSVFRTFLCQHDPVHSGAAPPTSKEPMRFHCDAPAGVIALGVLKRMDYYNRVINFDSRTGVGVNAAPLGGIELSP